MSLQGTWWCGTCEGAGRPKYKGGAAAMHEQFLAGEGVGLLHVERVLKDEYG